MRDDTKRELERLERELLEQEEAGQTADELLDDIKSMLGDEKSAEPAFDDPQTIHDPKGSMVYCNYSNDYGRDLQEFADSGEVPEKKTDKVTLGLLITACGLTAGIIGILIYWLVAYL